MQGPAIFLAQFLRDVPPYDRLETIAAWVGKLGYRGVQIPTWDPRVFDLDTAAEGAEFIRRHLIQTSPVAVDDFAGGRTDTGRNRRILGLDQA